MAHLPALIWKDINISIKNALIYSSVMMAPLMGFLATLNTENSTPESSLELLFLMAFMGVFISGINTTACLLAEEKETRTLNTLIVSGSKPLEILASKICSSFAIVGLSNMALFFIMNGLALVNLGQYIVAISIGGVYALIVGCIIGVYMSSQMKASFIAAFLGLAFMMFPNLASALYLPTWLDWLMLRTMPFSFARLLLGHADFSFAQDIMISLTNTLLVFVMFLLAYRSRAQQL